LADEFEFSFMESVETQFEEILVAEAEGAGEQAAAFSVDALCAIASSCRMPLAFALAHHSRRNPQASRRLFAARVSASSSLSR
jgi:hypothetical protein